MVVVKNVQILQMLRRISYQLMRDCSKPSDIHHLLLVRHCSLDISTLSNFCLQFDGIESKHRGFRRVGFSLINGVQINSQMFEVVSCEHWSDAHILNCL